MEPRGYPMPLPRVQDDPRHKGTTAGTRREGVIVSNQKTLAEMMPGVHVVATRWRRADVMLAPILWTRQPQAISGPGEFERISALEARLADALKCQSRQ